MRYLFLVLLASPLIALGAQEKSECSDAIAWGHWKNGSFAEAQSCAEQNLVQNRDIDSALSLLFLAYSAMGKYQLALDSYGKISRDFPRIRQMDSLVVDAFHNLGKFREAYEFARNRKIESEGYMNFVEALARNPTTYELHETTVVPFANKDPLSPFIPDLEMEIAGRKTTVYFDTGGSELVMAPSLAKRLGIQGVFFGWGRGNGQRTKIWFGQTDLKLGAVRAKNVPVHITESLEVEGLREKAIFGTGLIKRFLTTVDYPRNRLILSPKNNDGAKAVHEKMLTAESREMDFVMVSDHYMLAKGSLGAREDLTFFVDTGIVQWRASDQKQPAFLTSTEDLLELGYDKNELARSSYLEIPGGIGLGPVRQDNHILAHETGGELRNLAGVRVYGLIGHAFLKEYAWAIDFERRKYVFSK